MRLPLFISCASAPRWTPASGVEQVQNFLIAVTPIIGAPRAASVAMKITEALGTVIAAVEAELEGEEQGQ